MTDRIANLGDGRIDRDVRTSTATVLARMPPVSMQERVLTARNYLEDRFARALDVGSSHVAPVVAVQSLQTDVFAAMQRLADAADDFDTQSLRTMLGAPLEAFGGATGLASVRPSAASGSPNEGGMGGDAASEKTLSQLAAEYSRDARAAREAQAQSWDVAGAVTGKAQRAVGSSDRLMVVVEEKRLVAMHREIVQRRSAIDEIERELEAEKAVSERKNELLDYIRQTLWREVVALRDQLYMATKNPSYVAPDVLSLLDHVPLLQSRGDESSGELLRELETELANTKKRHAGELTKQQTFFNEQSKQRDAELAKLKQQAADAERILASLRAQSAEQSATADMQVRNLADTLADRDAQVAALTSETEELKREVSGQTAVIAGYKDQLQRMNGSINQIVEEKDRALVVQNQRIEDLEARLAATGSSQHHVDTLQTQLATAAASVQERDTTISELRKEVLSAKAALASAQEAAIKSVSAGEKAQTVVDQLVSERQRTQTLEQRVTTLEANRDELRMKLDASETARKTLDQELRESHTAIDKLQTEVSLAHELRSNASMSPGSPQLVANQPPSGFAPPVALSSSTTPQPQAASTPTSTLASPEEAPLPEPPATTAEPAASLPPEPTVEASRGQPASASSPTKDVARKPGGGTSSSAASAQALLQRERQAWQKERFTFDQRLNALSRREAELSSALSQREGEVAKLQMSLEVAERRLLQAQPSPLAPAPNIPMQEQSDQLAARVSTPTTGGPRRRLSSSGAAAHVAGGAAAAVRQMSDEAASAVSAQPAERRQSVGVEQALPHPEEDAAPEPVETDTARSQPSSAAAAAVEADELVSLRRTVEQLSQACEDAEMQARHEAEDARQARQRARDVEQQLSVLQKRLSAAQALTAASTAATDSRDQEPTAAAAPEVSAEQEDADVTAELRSDLAEMTEKFASVAAALERERSLREQQTAFSLRTTATILLDASAPTVTSDMKRLETVARERGGVSVADHRRASEFRPFHATFFDASAAFSFVESTLSSVRSCVALGCHTANGAVEDGKCYGPAAVVAEALAAVAERSRSHAGPLGIVTAEMLSAVEATLGHAPTTNERTVALRQADLALPDGDRDYGAALGVHRPSLPGTARSSASAAVVYTLFRPEDVAPRDSSFSDAAGAARQLDGFHESLVAVCRSARAMSRAANAQADMVKFVVGEDTGTTRVAAPQAEDSLASHTELPAAVRRSDEEATAAAEVALQLLEELQITITPTDGSLRGAAPLSAAPSIHPSSSGTLANNWQHTSFGPLLVSLGTASPETEALSNGDRVLSEEQSMRLKAVCGHQSFLALRERMHAIAKQRRAEREPPARAEAPPKPTNMDAPGTSAGTSRAVQCDLIVAPLPAYGPNAPRPGSAAPVVGRATTPGVAKIGAQDERLMSPSSVRGFPAQRKLHMAIAAGQHAQAREALTTPGLGSPTKPPRPASSTPTQHSPSQPAADDSSASPIDLSAFVGLPPQTRPATGHTRVPHASPAVARPASSAAVRERYTGHHPPRPHSAMASIGETLRAQHEVMDPSVDVSGSHMAPVTLPTGFGDGTAANFMSRDGREFVPINTQTTAGEADRAGSGPSLTSGVAGQGMFAQQHADVVRNRTPALEAAWLAYPAPSRFSASSAAVGATSSASAAGATAAGRGTGLDGPAREHAPASTVPLPGDDGDDTAGDDVADLFETGVPAERQTLDVAEAIVGHATGTQHPAPVDPRGVTLEPTSKRATSESRAVRGVKAKIQRTNEVRRLGALLGDEFTRPPAGGALSPSPNSAPFDPDVQRRSAAMRRSRVSELSGKNGKVVGVRGRSAGASRSGGR